MRPDASNANKHAKMYLLNLEKLEKVHKGS